MESGRVVQDEWTGRQWAISSDLHHSSHLQPTTNQSHTHTRLTAHFPGLRGWAGTRKVKPIWISLKQETVSGSGISWAICKFAPRPRLQTDNYASTSPLSFLQAGCPSCRPTNSVKALKAKYQQCKSVNNCFVHFRGSLTYLLTLTTKCNGAAL